jgi:7-alpha-hydroxysteroid dehydrogenase
MGTMPRPGSAVGPGRELFMLTDRVAVVTGAGRGIGAATARVLAQAGADVLISSRDADDLALVAKEIEALGRSVEVVAADLSELDAVASLAETAVRRFGRLDIVVNNVGGADPAPFAETTVEALEGAFRFNVSTAHVLTQAALPYLTAAAEQASAASEGPTAENGPSVVTISSAYGGRLSARGMAAYGTVKAALSHWTRMTAVDLAPRIRVNGIEAGVIASSALRPVVTNQQLRAAFEQTNALRRLGTPQDIAAGVLYLVSPAGSFITGKLLEIDGGPGRAALDLGIPDY